MLLNHGDGTFAPRVGYRVGLSTMCVGSADLDGDGGNDLAVIHDRGVSVLPNVSDIPVPTAVSEQAELSSLVPEAYSLSQNFPNPFNSDTVIRFALPTSEDIELSIFNLAGQKVAT